MNFEEAMLVVIAGYPVRRVGWHSPYQCIWYSINHKYNCFRNRDSGYYPKEVDLIAEDWYIVGNEHETGWYYPEMYREKAYILYSDDMLMDDMTHALTLMEESK